MTRPSNYKIDEYGRQCIKCKQYKTWDNYHKTWSGVNGYQNTCKLCKGIDINDSFVGISPELANELFKRRIESNLSRPQLSKKIKLGAQAISDLENKKYNKMRYSTMKKLCFWFDIDYKDYL